MLDMAAEIRLRRCRLTHSFASPHIQGGRWTETIRQQASPSRDVVEIDFHACRVAYINLVLESGVSLKEAHPLSRHATPELITNVYGRVPLP